MLVVSWVGYLPLSGELSVADGGETVYSPCYLCKVALPTNHLHRTPGKRET